ncbi:hypothetical protein ARMGADRAFT_107766 [Armillaria gallica]|uniref:Uncharacterized protein n=1 Tax=Armillaria gallica TaxID=47427 RepID=A0A2H3DF46_ARMGA|nr:hypothetical protein ARMGADRAFT_107766 [Armillaria gallica]
MPFVCQPPRSRCLVMSRLHTISTPPASSPPSRFTTIASSTVRPHFRGCRSKHCCLFLRQDRCRCRRSAQLLTFPTNHGPPTSTAAPTSADISPPPFLRMPEVARSVSPSDCSCCGSLVFHVFFFIFFRPDF